MCLFHKICSCLCLSYTHLRKLLSKLNHFSTFYFKEKVYGRNKNFHEVIFKYSVLSFKWFCIQYKRTTEILYFHIFLTLFPRKINIHRNSHWKKQCAFLFHFSAFIFCCCLDHRIEQKYRVTKKKVCIKLVDFSFHYPDKSFCVWI